mgnify:CR=1
MKDDEKLEVRGRLSRNQFISSINKLSLIFILSDWIVFINSKF